MKRSNLIILLMACAIGSIFSTSCKKSFLEKPKGGNITVDTIFNKQLQAQYAINDMYNRCIQTYFPMEYNGTRPETITDQNYIIHPAYDWATSSINAGDYITGNMGTDNTIDKWGFGGHYAGIRQANLVLQNIGKVSDADEAWKNDIRGQALFCRALQHFELFRLYGGIPIVTTPLDGNGNINIPRRSVKSVVDSIVSWCDQANNLINKTEVRLGTGAGANYGKITGLAALALKSRVLLYAASPLYNTPSDKTSAVEGARFKDERDSVLAYPTYDKERWNLAAKAAKAVIDAAPSYGTDLYVTGKTETTSGDTYDGLGDYEAVSNQYANKELILVATENQVGEWGNGSPWGKYLLSKVRLAAWGTKNITPIEFVQQYERKDGASWTFPQSGNDVPVDIPALNLDPRFYQTIAYDGMYYNSTRGAITNYKEGDGYAANDQSRSDAGPDGYALECFKFVARVNNFDDTHFAWPVFRFAEIYLNYAEALNEYQGPAGDPVKYINLIRARAGMFPKAATTVDAFRETIHHERNIELAFEGHRYNDLNRWLESRNVLDAKALHTISSTAKKVNGALTRKWEQVLIVTRYFPARYYYIPFPSGEVSKRYLGNASWNGQNPGW